MNRPYLNRFGRALKTMLGSEHLTKRGRETRYTQRLRDVTPQRLVCALVSALGAQRVETLADLRRAFNAASGLSTRYKAFYNRLAKPEFPVFMQQVYQDLVRELSQNVLRPLAGSGLDHFTDVWVQDGSSFAVHDALERVYGGRFTKVRPAAVELHSCLSVYRDQDLATAVAADRKGERDFLPAARALRGKLLLADRGYWDLDYWRAVDQAGGFFLARGKTSLNPLVLEVRGPGGRLPRFENRPLQSILRRLPRRRLDLVVEWTRPGDVAVRLRLILDWNFQKGKYLVLGTNVPRTVLRAQQLVQVYHLRWQVELLFKEWKSYTNLHEFPSSNPAVVEGLIWASLCAAVIKRSLAHASQRAGSKRPISTRITAMCGSHILPGLVRCALRKFHRLTVVLEEIVRFLWDNAPRPHPERDRVRGRMQFGVGYVGLES